MGINPQVVAKALNDSSSVTFVPAAIRQSREGVEEGSVVASPSGVGVEPRSRELALPIRLQSQDNLPDSFFTDTSQELDCACGGKLPVDHVNSPVGVEGTHVTIDHALTK